MQTELERYQKCSVHLNYLVNKFNLWHLRRLRDRFDGDLECALILGEIAHYNVQNIFLRNKLPTEEFNQMINNSNCLNLYSDSHEISHLIKNCNALSISTSTGIPRETVRRKIKLLNQRGWIAIDDKGLLSVTSAPANEFRKFNQEMLEEFLATAEQVRRILQQKLPSDGI